MQPEDVLPGDIDANLGAPWIPESDIRDFTAHLFGVPGGRDQRRSPEEGRRLEPRCRLLGRAVGRCKNGVPAPQRANGTWLLELGLNMKSPVIYDPDPNDPDKRVVNHEETLAAREKQRAIKEKFKQWVFTDPDRTERLVRTYNDNFNNLRPRLFDGSHLDFPGMNQSY